jgi:hypothetical protein
MKKVFFYAFSALLFVTTSCSDNDEPAVVNEEEVITKVTIQVTNLSDSSTSIYTFSVEPHDHSDDDDHADDDDHSDDDDHADGDHMEIELASNSSYLFEFKVLNDTDPNNVENVTLEIIDEADKHQVFYEILDSSISIEASADDTFDSNSNPVMLKTIWTTTTATVADVEAFLIHNPSSKNATTREGFGGSADVEIEFEAHVE